MAYTRPTLTELKDNVRNNLFSRMPTADPSLRNSFLNVLVLVFAGILHGLYGAVEFFSRQPFPDVADKEYLDRWGAIIGVLRNPATKAVGTLRFTGTNTTVIIAGTQVSRSDGILFSTNTAGTITGGIADIAITCEEFGTTGNTETGATFYLIQTETGVDSIATLQDPGTTGGRARQADSSFRTDILTKLREPPRGGSVNDYIFWTKEAVNATRVWIRTFNENAGSNPDFLSLGQVKTYFMMDGQGVDGIPTAGQVADVLAYQEAQAEPTARLIVAAPTADPVDFEINILPNNTTTQEQVEDAIDNLLVAESSPGGTITTTRILKALSSVGSLQDYELVAPATDITAARGEIHTKGTLTIGDV